MFSVVGVSGSLRRGSFNRALLLTVQEMAAPKLQIAVQEIGDLPLYNQDLETAELPSAVTRLRSAVRAADALLIATPEYNHSVPGVLKNAIDWLSRPPRQSALERKPAAIMGASPGMTGTARAQGHLRQSLVFTNTPTLLQPEVLVARAHEKFDASGRLTDDATRKFLALFIDEFVRWIVRFREPVAADDAA